MNLAVLASEHKLKVVGMDKLQDTFAVGFFRCPAFSVRFEVNKADSKLFAYVYNHGDYVVIQIAVSYYSARGMYGINCLNNFFQELGVNVYNGSLQDTINNWVLSVPNSIGFNGSNIYKH